MTEKNYVVNVKSKLGTIITVRGDSAEELATNIGGLISNGLQDHVLAMEELFVGPQTAVGMVKEALGATVTEVTPITDATNFAPVKPPVTTQAATTGGAGTASRNCIHGPMTKRTGEGQWGPYKAFYCPTPKGTADQCKPQYVKANDPEWATF